MATDNNDQKSFVARFANSICALVGAVSPSEFGAKFEDWCKAVVGRVDALEAKAHPAPFDASELNAKIAALEAGMSALGTRAEIIAAVTESATATASTAANNRTTEILGAIGINPQVAAAPSNPAQPDAKLKPLSEMTAQEKSSLNWTQYALQSKAKTQNK